MLFCHFFYLYNKHVPKHQLKVKFFYLCLEDFTHLNNLKFLIFNFHLRLAKSILNQNYLNQTQ